MYLVRGNAYIGVRICDLRTQLHRSNTKKEEVVLDPFDAPAAAVAAVAPASERKKNPVAPTVIRIFEVCCFYSCFRLRFGRQ